MKKLDIIIIGLMLFGALWLAFLPDKEYDYHEISPEELLYKMNTSHYISTDEVAKAIMGKDPSYILVDIRSPEEYSKYTLPGALNIPYDSLLNDTYRDYFDQDVYKTVLFSNGSSLADQAWLVLTRMGFEGNYVMKGGLNEWIETIIRPQRPADWAEPDAWKLYEFRKGASRFFGGGSEVVQEEQVSAPAAVVPVKRKKTESVGGCE